MSIVLRPKGFEPDFTNIEAILQKQKPSRFTLYEFFWSDALSARVAGVPCYPKYHTPEDIQVKVKAFYNLGYDYANIHGSEFCFPTGNTHHLSTVSLNENTPITDRKSFDEYPWQDPDAADYSRLEYSREFLPKGMKLITHGPLGVLENVVALAGYDNLCMMLYDDPQLFGDLFEEVGSRLVRYFENCVQHDTVGAILVNDDWGFNTQTMLSPDTLREYVFPWHKKIVEIAHKAGKPAILHSCGNYDSIIDDIIYDMKYDGRHSYEDSITPVEKAYMDFNGKLAVMGGIDMGFMSTATEQQVFKRSRKLLELTECKGFGLGTGNSVPEYVPDRNFFALIRSIWSDKL
jgi:uroporphyrinogen decarboxylase